MGLDSEAVRMAGQLVRMAGVFEREATGWADYPRVARRCREAMDQMTDCARYVLRTGDLVYGDGWLAAGGMTLTHLQLARLFRDGMAWAQLQQ